VTYYWHMTTDTYTEYRAICNNMAIAAQESNQEAYEEAKDLLQSLPGFPHGIDPDTRVVPVVDDTPTPMVQIH